MLEGRRPQGASTITQQVARDFLLNSDVKIARKMREAILAIRIDATYPKEKILELYLNEINLGENCYGVGGGGAELFRQVAGRARLSPKSPSWRRCPSRPAITIRASITRRRWTAATG